jgi:opacity protein-like surface antigen
VRKYIIVSILTLSAFTLSAGDKFGISLHAGYNMPKEAIYQKGIAGGLGLQFNFSKVIGIELAAVYSTGNVSEGNGSPGKGKLTRIIPQVNLVGRIPFGSKIKGILLAGVLYSKNDYSLDKSVSDGLEPYGFLVEASMESGIGYQAGAGVEISLGKKFSIQLDGRYLMNKAKGKWKITDQVSSISMEGNLPDTSLDGILVSAGVRVWL